MVHRNQAVAAGVGRLALKADDPSFFAKSGERKPEGIRGV